MLHLKKRVMLRALEYSLGIVSIAVKKAGIERMTHYRWLKTDPAYRRAVEDLENIILDFAEEALFYQMRRGNITAIIFYLKCKGKKRGYTDKREMGFTDFQKENIQIVFNLPPGHLLQ